MSGVPQVTLVREGYGWIVLKDGVQVYGPADKYTAENSRDRIARQARHIRRPCITCGQPFQSEGAHNRMCPICRARANTVFQGVV